MFLTIRDPFGPIWTLLDHGVRKKFSTHILCQRWSGKSFMKIGYSKVPKPSYCPLLWPAEWKMTAPLATIKPIIHIRRGNNFLTKTKGILCTNKANRHCDTVHSICSRMSLEVFLKVLIQCLNNLGLWEDEDFWPYVWYLLAKGNVWVWLYGPIRCRCDFLENLRFIKSLAP